jgi:uncharacterized membrane protein YphA (DoxX/SURF4 family)
MQSQWGNSEMHFRISSLRLFARAERVSRTTTTTDSSKRMGGGGKGGGKFLAHFGRALLASLFLFSGMHKYHALARANSMSDFHLLEHSIAPRFAETRAALSASLAKTYYLKSVSSEKEIMEHLLALDDATIAMCGTIVEILGSVLLMLNFTLGSKLLMAFVSCVTPIMHPFWRREEFSASREIETIMFWKNAALFGALAMHVGMSKEEAKEEKEKEE